MITSPTLDRIEAIAAQRYAAEAIRNAPKPAAIRTVYTLSSLLAELDAADRAQVLDLLRDEILAIPVTA
jgi:hypothetical protein